MIQSKFLQMFGRANKVKLTGLVMLRTFNFSPRHNVRVNEPAPLADPEQEGAEGIKSHRLWKLMGGATASIVVVALTGIEVTRHVKRVKRS